MVHSPQAAHTHREGDRPVVAWHPIETAPTDGTPVLAYGETAGEIHGPAGFPSIEVAVYGGPGGDYPGYDWETNGDAYAVWMKPTHWLPLPAPPLLDA